MEKPDNSLILNVCIIPNEDVALSCESISQSLKSENTMFVLDGNKFAHMTLFMARFDVKNMDKVVQAVERALKSAPSFDCEHVGYFLTEGRYLEVSYRKSPPFVQLHEALIDNVAGLRINPEKPYKEEYFIPYNEEQQRNAKETGYDLAYRLYRPHITLTRYKKGAIPKYFPAFPEVNLSFNLSKIGIYKADDNGAVYESLAEFQV